MTESHTLHDLFFKRSLKNKEIAIDFFKAHLPRELYARINIESLELIDKSFVMETLHTLLDRLSQLKNDSRSYYRTVLKYLINLGSAVHSDYTIYDVIDALVTQLPQEKEAIMSFADDLREEGFHKGLEKGVIQGLEQGREEGLEQGLEEGREQGIREIVKNMLQTGLADSMIKKLTGLSEEELLQLKNETYH